MINQYREQNCVTLDKSVRNETVSTSKRDKPVWLKEQEEEPCQRVRKRDKPVVKKICYI